jgi:hydrogenase expression/formation protein HypC
MCLGVPGKVLSINGLEAEVDFFGVTKQLRLDIVDAPVAVGDYVLNHVGFAIRRIPHDEAQGTLALFEQILKDAREGDLMAAEVRAELASAPTVAKKDGA